MILTPWHCLSSISTVVLQCVQSDTYTVDRDSLCDEAGERISDLEQKLALANASEEMAMEEIKRLKSQAKDDLKKLADCESKISEYQKEKLVLIEEKCKLEDKLADEIGHLKSVIKEQAQEIDGLNKACKEQAQLEAQVSEHSKGNLTLLHELKSAMEEIGRLKSLIDQQAKEVAGKDDEANKDRSLAEEKAKLEEKLRRQKHELATLNKKVENSTKIKAGCCGLHCINLQLMARIERQKKELANLNKQVVELKKQKKAKKHSGIASLETLSLD